ncbi:MAG TPA: peptidase M20, partial [Firmicutes bacterium]|nr:peptidase M20 [Bacillota bacterium]
CAHMDRVRPGFGIKPQLKDGVIRSDGTTILAADDVAGIVAILEALRIIKEQKLPHGRIEILFTVAEEGGLFGAKSLD